MVGFQLTVAAANSVTSPKQKTDRERSVFIVVDEGNKITKVNNGSRQDPHSKTEPHRHNGAARVCYQNSHLFPCRPCPTFTQVSTGFLLLLCVMAPCSIAFGMWWLWSPFHSRKLEDLPLEGVAVSPRTVTYTITNVEQQTSTVTSISTTTVVQVETVTQRETSTITTRQNKPQNTDPYFEITHIERACTTILRAE